MKKDLIKQISNEFKSKIPGLIKRNKIDKAKLGEFVFSNPDELKKNLDTFYTKRTFCSN